MVPAERVRGQGRFPSRAVLKLLLLAALAHGKCVVRFLDGCSLDANITTSISAADDERGCLARAQEGFHLCGNQRHQQVLATFLPTGATSVFPADDEVEEAILRLDSLAGDRAVAHARRHHGLPLLLFPQCKIDGFWSNHRLLQIFVYAARTLLRAGVQFRFVVPDLHFWEQPAGVHSKISSAPFEKVYDIEHFQRFLGAQVIGQSSVDATEGGRPFQRAFFVTTRRPLALHDQGDLFDRCAGAEGLQGISTVLPSAQSVFFDFNTRTWIEELAALMTGAGRTAPASLFIIHGVPRSVVNEASAAGQSEPRGDDGLSPFNLLHNHSVPGLQLAATVRNAAAFVRALWNISAEGSWVHLHVRRGITPNLPGWHLGQMSLAEIEFALERAFHEASDCLHAHLPGRTTVVVSSIQAVSVAIHIQTLYPGIAVRVFDASVWDALSASAIDGWQDQQISRDLVEVQMMRDAGVLIGSRSSMSEQQFWWRALTRGGSRACNINGQPCFARRPDYHNLEGTQRLACLNENA